MSELEISGTKLHYEDTGSGEAILCLHGYCMNLHLWDAQVADLARDHRVIAVDLPGHGSSEPLAAGFSFEDLAELMVALIDQLGIGDFHVAGMSQGGFTALRLALLAPKRVRSVALVASAPRAKVNEAFAGMVEGFRQGQRDQIIPMVVTLQMEPGTAERDPDLIARQIATIDREMTDASLVAYGEAVLDQSDVSDRLSEIEVPVLLVHGDADTGISIEESREAEPLFSNARLVEIPGGGHNINFQSAAEVSAAMREFYDDISKTER